MPPRTNCRLSRQGFLPGVRQLVRVCGTAHFCILSPSLLSITISSESANRKALELRLIQVQPEKPAQNAKFKTQNGLAIPDRDCGIRNSTTF